MESQLLPIISIISLLFVASHATLSPEAYWNSVLPNTVIPKAVKDLINPGTNVGVGEGGVRVGSGHKGKPLPVFVKPGRNVRIYKYRATETQLHDTTSRAIFFLEKDLKPGMSMRLAFTKNDGDATFLARSESEKIPFSSNKMSNVLEIYDVNTGSGEAQAMTETVKVCEETAVKGEDKYCATSLESMVDFSISKLGNNIRAISTEKRSNLRKNPVNSRHSSTNQWTDRSKSFIQFLSKDHSRKSRTLSVGNNSSGATFRR